VQPALDPVAFGRRQMRGEFHRCLPMIAGQMLPAGQDGNRGRPGGY
jgi:hypothetical protein